MISLELSTIQYNSLQSAIINAQVDEFLRNGGEISSAPPIKPTPLPYGRLKPIDESTKLVRAKPKESRRKPTIHSPELISQIAKMAETKSCCDIARELGMTYDQVKCIGSRNGFTFKKAENFGHQNVVHQFVDEQNDLRNVERIKAFKELGVTRRQAMARMEMGTSQFYRLLKKYQIDYPKAQHAAVWVMQA
jgi:transposase